MAPKTSKQTKTKKMVSKKKVAAKKPQPKGAKPAALKVAPKVVAPKLTPASRLVIRAEEVVQHKPMTQAELEEVEQKLQDEGYRLSIMTNISDAERKLAFETALEKAIRAQKPYETTWEGNIVTLWVKKDTPKRSTGA